MFGGRFFRKSFHSFCTRLVNRLATLATKDTDYAGIADYLSGPTALAYSTDPVAAALDCCWGALWKPPAEGHSARRSPLEAPEAALPGPGRGGPRAGPGLHAPRAFKVSLFRFDTV